MSHLAVIGAAGFIGRRSVELLRSSGHQVVPIVRPGANRNAADHVAADALDEEALTTALRGCEAAVISIAGSTSTIVDGIDPIYRAAVRSGVRRIVHLSSAAVHGQAPPAGTNEQTPLSLDQPFAYNQAKIRAEQRLQELRRDHPVEVIMLRPLIVYGPGSRWIADFAADVTAGRAALFDRGEGICNAIYIDNLVHAIERSIDATVPPAEAFLLNDMETVRWRDLLGPVAAAQGHELDALQQLSSRRVIEEQTALRSRQVARSRWWRWWPGASTKADDGLLEAALLQSCKARLPIEKARTILGYDPPFTFSEGVQKSLEWLHSTEGQRK